MHVLYWVEIEYVLKNTLSRITFDWYVFYTLFYKNTVKKNLKFASMFNTSFFKSKLKSNIKINKKKNISNDKYTKFTYIMLILKDI